MAAFLLALSCLLPLTVQAGVFKCVATNGEISFSQTPCPEKKKELTAKEDAPDDTDVDEKDGELTEIALASHSPRTTTPNSTEPQSTETRTEPEKTPDNPALRAKKRQADARDEENRLQCEDNIKAQINSINSQIHTSTLSSSLGTSLMKKRRALENRLNDC